MRLNFCNHSIFKRDATGRISREWDFDKKCWRRFNPALRHVKRGKISFTTRDGLIIGECRWRDGYLNCNELGELHGPFENDRMRCNYVNGYIDGEQEDKCTSAITNWKMGLKHGRCEEEDGVRYYEDGLLHGVSVIKSGSIIKTLTYEHGILISTEGEYLTGEKASSGFNEWYRNGKVKAVANGMVVDYFDRNGIKEKTITYKLVTEDVENHVVTQSPWCEIGIRYDISKSPTRSSHFDEAKALHFHNNGQLVHYSTDEDNIGWHKNGFIKYIRLPNGNQEIWYSNGKKKLEDIYEEDIENFTKWDKDGNLACRFISHNGETMERTEYVNGVIQTQYIDGIKTEYFKSGRKKMEVGPNYTKKWRNVDGDVLIYHRQDGVVIFKNK